VGVDRHGGRPRRVRTTAAGRLAGRLGGLLSHGRGKGTSLLATLLLLLAVPAQADSLAVTAALDPETGAVDGALAWTVSNPTRAPIDHVELFVYPRIYRDDPKLDDVLEPRVYPFAFDPGDQRLLCDHSEVVTEPEGLPVARIDLPAPLAPGATTEVICGFTTTIPVRYGTFGRLRQTVTLNGGLSPLPVTLAPDGRWLHQAPPPRIEQTLQLDVPDGWGAVVGGAIQDPADCELVADAIPRTGPRSWLPVSVHEDLQRQSIPLADGQTATWVGRELRRRQKRWVRRAVEGARRTLAEAGLPAPERGVVLIEAPLRRNLVEPGDGVIFVSDRFLETAEIFWRYHDLHLARAVMAEQLRDLVDVREQPLHVPTTLHGVSWTLVPRYLRQRWKNHVNLKQLLEGVRFLPAIDNLLETPIFPFADQIFDAPSGRAGLCSSSWRTSSDGRRSTGRSTPTWPGRATATCGPCSRPAPGAMCARRPSIGCCRRAG
jgi:hypothetical protein